eukprot:1093896-Rhodomonas_salina.1
MGREAKAQAGKGEDGMGNFERLRVVKGGEGRRGVDKRVRVGGLGFKAGKCSVGRAGARAGVY